MTADELKFHKLLALLSARCGAELDAIEIEIYDKHLGHYGYSQACQALERCLIELGPSDRMPSVAKIAEKLDSKFSQKTLITDFTNHICNAIARKGHNWVYKVQDLEADMVKTFGQIGLESVRLMGGWDAVCELANGNPNYYRNIVKDTVTAVVERQNKGLINASSVKKQLDIMPNAAKIDRKSD